MDNNNFSQVTGHPHSAAASGDIRIYVAAPCHRGSFSSVFVVSLGSLLNSSQNAGVSYHFEHGDMADIALSRNLLITRFYYELQDHGHILFLDSDMGFEPSLINRMIGLNESVVGVVAPRRGIDLEKLHEQADHSFANAFARSTGFVPKLPEEKIQEHKPGFIQVDFCSAGILLVSRDCVIRMIECCPEIVDRNVSKYPPSLHGFDALLTPFKRIETATEFYADDASFCHRWVNQCGGRIYANVDSEIKHRGFVDVETCYEDAFR